MYIHIKLSKCVFSLFYKFSESTRFPFAETRNVITDYFPYSEITCKRGIQVDDKSRDTIAKHLAKRYRWFLCPLLSHHSLPVPHAPYCLFSTYSRLYLRRTSTVTGTYERRWNEVRIIATERRRLMCLALIPVPGFWERVHWDGHGAEARAYCGASRARKPGHPETRRDK